jgi:hypothetical protein
MQAVDLAQGGMFLAMHGGVRREQRGRSRMLEFLQESAPPSRA